MSEFSRFSAWGVFGLSLITLGIYPIYWLYTRANIINQHHENKISMVWLNLLVISFIIAFFGGFLGQSAAVATLLLATNIVYMVSYLASLFKVRNRLQDMMNERFGAKYSVGPVLTFFFSAIYLQYKINQCIDDANQGAE
ncbi:DUF4234 domain-containing protein [Microbulbifer hainanensis]|uniref:DUF4234 domain-containing protein n=1 Tax=Microbulbifer hainanensis TaxID=2735675 RepID=UPI001866773E|nr:DUF4234 domain-containing protein [Microbulbifer hainanensis]